MCVRLYFFLCKLFSCLVLRSKQVCRTRYDKSPLDARCCHLANDLTKFTGDRQTNERTNRWTASLPKSPAFAREGFKGKALR